MRKVLFLVAALTCAAAIVADFLKKSVDVSGENRKGHARSAS